ncbi:MAG TPA: alpha/beta hydrolase [Ilumatobacteraceae bacterium]|nr:alpha/beta hydrolase [Ilumatobacteraceae bacterium]
MSNRGEATPDYDEFGLFHENIAEFDLDVVEVPGVVRIDTPVPDGDAGSRIVSALRWGSDEPELVLVHGGAQNAHTWDTVALALGRPLLSVDLPGHGHSDWRADGAYSPMNLADDVAAVMTAHAPTARVVVGMSLGGLTAMELAVRYPALVRGLVMVDITPGVNAAKTKAITEFVDGPQEFASFDDLLARTMEHNPTRSESSLRRGILHNAHQQPDGSWQWRYDRGSHARARGSDPVDSAPDASGDSVASSSTPDDTAVVLSPLWDDFGSIRCPVTLVRGSLSPVVDDDDVAEARRRQPDLVVHVVDGAGHSVQGDRPVELAAILAPIS